MSPALAAAPAPAGLVAVVEGARTVGRGLAWCYRQIERGRLKAYQVGDRGKLLVELDELVRLSCTRERRAA